jgi:hypothetical protein
MASRPTKTRAQRPAAHSSRRAQKDPTWAVLEGALRGAFPHDTVDISKGYRNNIHLLVVSRLFDSMSDAERQDMIWSLIDSTPLTGDQKSRISLVLPLSPAELK